MSATFCALPFLHLALLPDGTAKMCCMAAGRITEGGTAMSVHRQPLDGIWNSAYLAEARARMLAGEAVRDCEACYRAEASSGTSYRLASNARWPAARLAPRPLSLQLMPGNACNLACRMCSPLYSSRIASDAVHARWSRIFLDGEDRIDWSRDRVTLAPGRPVDVAASGVHRVERHQDAPLQWTDGNARWVVDVPPGVSCRALHVDFLEGQDPRRRLAIRINGSTRFAGRMKEAGTGLVLPLAADTPRLVIECESEAARPANDARTLGVALRGLAIACDTPLARRERHGPAHAGMASVPWHADLAWVETSLLADPGSLAAIYITGGEPMIIPEVAAALALLQSKGVAKRIELELNTNGTLLDEALLARLLAFKRVSIAMSIDGHGVVNEYIRHPSRWEAVAANLLRLRALEPAVLSVSVITIVQAYNALQVTDLLRFLDGHGIDFTMEVATDPAPLAVGVMPPAARALAVRRLREFAAGLATGGKRAHVEGVADTIEATPAADPAIVQAFHDFTRDLDRSRGQDFGAACPELDAAFAAAALPRQAAGMT